MSVKKILQKYPYLLYDGPMETRIQYGTDLMPNKEIAIFRLVNTKAGRDALTKLYRTDIETVQPFHLPVILNAPTFCASRAHCQRLGLPYNNENVYKINKECIELVQHKIGRA